MENEKLLKDFEERFERMKKDLGFSSSLKEIDEIFFLEDVILKDGFVSSALSRQICHRIVDTYMSWNNYLHGLVMPNPHNMMVVNESKAFNDEEKKEATKLITEAMALVSTNTLVGLTKNKKVEAKFVDDAVKFWNNRYNPKLIEIMKKVNTRWKNEK